MNLRRLVMAGAAAAAVTLASFGQTTVGTGKIQHVVLLSIDGMHAVDFYNCANGIAGVNSGKPYCPNLAALGQTGINYVGAISSMPSDSFPGLAAIVTGGSPKTTGLYYDVSYDRSLAPPANTTGTGLAGGSCTPYGPAPGTTTDYDQGIELDDTMLNGGAPGAALTEGGVASIDPTKLVRDPVMGCVPIYPWDFVRVNTIFSVVHGAGGYTAWIDKHASYSFVSGPGGMGLNDYYSPEVDSNVVALPGVTTAQGASCATVRDTSNTGSWTASFQNIQCYDALKVTALLNQIAGKTHNGGAAQIPALFGMNFQALYIGQSLSESGGPVGGYQNAAAVPSAALLGQIEFVDSEIGAIVKALTSAGLINNTLIVVTAKHGMSPIDPTRYVADGSNTPATLLGTAIPFSESPLNSTGIGATEDDVSVLWLNPGASVSAAVQFLEQNATAIGMGEIFYGPTLAMNYNVGGTGPGQDPRSPDIIVVPNVGVVYSGSTTMIGDHGGFSHDSTNVIMLVSNPSFTPQTVAATTRTMQVAPTIVQALGLDPKALQAVVAEGTEVLPEVAKQIAKIQ